MFIESPKHVWVNNHTMGVYRLKSLVFESQEVAVSIELVQNGAEYLESSLHGRETAVLVVSMVDTGVAVTTHLRHTHTHTHTHKENVSRVSDEHSCCYGMALHRAVYTHANIM